MIKLILIRHGETIENKKGKIQGQLPGRLSKVGIIQVKKLADRLKNEKIDVLYSSSLKRAIDTTKIIAKFHPGISIKIDKRLIERGFGNFEGMSMRKFKSLNLNINSNALIKKEGVEKIENLMDRIKKIVEEIKKENIKKTILISGHFGIDIGIISYLLNKKWEDLAKFQKIPNASVSIFEFKNSAPVLKTAGCCNHLTNFIPKNI